MELIKEREVESKQRTKAAGLTRVCFVCTGNTCRSPMAQAVANAYAKRLERTDLRAYSAGLFAKDGEPIAPPAVRALERAGVEGIVGRDYHLHTAHTLTEQEAADYDLLVGMTDEHVLQLMMRFPQAANRIVRMPSQIADPYGGDDAVYAQCLEQICRELCALLFPELGE